MTKLFHNYLDKSRFLNILKESTEIENPLYNHERYFLKYLKKLEDADIDFLKFLWEQRRQEISLARINKYCSVYLAYLKKIELKTIDILTFDNLYIKIKKSNKKSSSKRSDLAIIKQICKHLELPIPFDKYRIKLEPKVILNDELLTEDEKHTIISSKINLEKKAFLTIHFDGALRVGETFSVTRESFKKVEKGYLVTIRKSKTEIRTILTYSHNYHIEKLLKTSWQSWSFGYPMIMKVLKRFEKLFDKRLYTHLGRHTKITELAQKLTEQEIKNYCGLSPSSNVLKNYVHLNNTNVLNKLESMI
jgi:hypothetical protein